MYVINRESIQGHTISKLEIIEATHIKDERLETQQKVANNASTFWFRVSFAV